MGAAPSAVPGANPGAQQAGLSKVRAAINILVEALPSLGVGTEQFKGVHQVIGTLGRIAPPSSEVPGVQKTTAQGLLADANKNAMMDAVRGASPALAGAGGGGPAAGGPPTPAMPPSLAA